MLTLVKNEAGKTKSKLAERLLALAGKCDDKGRLPVECSGEFIALLQESLKESAEVTRICENLGKRINETESAVNELEGKNNALIVFIDYVGEFIEQNGLYKEFGAFLDEKFKSMPDATVN
ncbi:MAG: hypothetical protein ABFD50_05155 [Smithella sp.]